MTDDAEAFGIVANVRHDPTLRSGAKVWLVDGWSGGGWERVYVRGLSAPGDTVLKWMPAADLRDVRVAWVPEHLREDVRVGDRPSAETICKAIDNWIPGETTIDHQD